MSQRSRRRSDPVTGEALGSRRHLRTVEILRKRFGDNVLQETHAALRQAESEQADTERHRRQTPRATAAQGG